MSDGSDFVPPRTTHSLTAALSGRMGGFSLGFTSRKAVIRDAPFHVDLRPRIGRDEPPAQCRVFVPRDRRSAAKSPDLNHRSFASGSYATVAGDAVIPRKGPQAGRGEQGRPTFDQTALFWRRSRAARTRITLSAKNGVFLTRKRN
jgi:hypothetical protein